MPPKKLVSGRFCSLRPREMYNQKDAFWADQSIYKAWDSLRKHYHDDAGPVSIGSIRTRLQELGSPFNLDELSQQLWLAFVAEMRFVQQEAGKAGLQLKPLEDKDAVDQRIYTRIASKKERLR